MAVFVDFVGFEEPAGLFVIKELAMQPISSNMEITVNVFEPPCLKNQLSEQYQSTIEFIEKNQHGIPWDSGDVPNDFVNQIIEEKLANCYDYIFVKGVDRKNWLLGILKYKTAAIINLDDIGCPETNKLQCDAVIKHSFGHPSCKNYNCAYENVQRYKTWYIKEFSLRSNLRKSIILFCAVERLSEMSTKDIAKLPIIAITRFSTTEIDSTWDKLSDEQKQHPVIAGWKRCKDHPLDNEIGDIVGFFYYSYVKDCIQCQGRKNIK